MKNKRVLALVLAVAMMVGTSLSAFADNTDVSVNDNTVTFEAGGGSVTPPVDPEKPDEEIDPDEPKVQPTGNEGSLRLDIVPGFDFGTNSITTGDKVYWAELPEDPATGDEIPYFVQVTDIRGTGDGWSLSAKMTDQFTDGANTLDGAAIELKNVVGRGQEGTISPEAYGDEWILEYDAVNDKTVKIATAAQNAGMGISVVRFGDTTRHGHTLTADKSVELTIPAATQVYVATYTATIQWTLGATP